MKTLTTFHTIPHLLLATLLVVVASPGFATSPPDIILIVLDDAGIEQFDFYNFRGPTGLYAETEFLSNKVETLGEATHFTNAWSHPFCSPTRASFHTGDHAFRTGIGDVINSNTTYGLDVDDTDLLPKLMESTASSTTGYVTGLFGKWHLGTSDDQDNYDAPASAGYSNFSALFLDKQDSPSATGAPYFKFTITRDGTPNPVDTDYDAKIGHPTEEDKEIYATQLIIDDAIDWISDRETNGDSYFAYIPFFSPHDPVHCPFEGSGTAYPNGDFECTGEGTLAFDEQFRSMIETVDIEIERLLDETTTDPLVIIVSDNGTDSEDLDVDPWSSNKAKGTVGQGGVLVPFIAFGATVQEDVVIEDSVNLNDLYATILDFAGKSTLTPSPTDSQSLKDLLTGVSSTAPHEFNYTETFYPNFDPGSDFGPCRGVQAVQEDPGEYATSTFKYLRVLDGQSALYDLDEDPVEDDNLISSPPDANRLADLEYYIDTTLDSDLASICDDSLLKPIDGDCDEDADCCSNNCSEATDKCICPAP